MPKYREVVFLQTDYFDSWYAILDEKGQREAFEYLLQWEHGDALPLAKDEPWGSSDDTFEIMDGDNKYVVSYSWGLMYVGLTQLIETEELYG